MTKQAVLFPGQGAQFVGMSADLISRCPATEPMFEAASKLLGDDLWKLTTEGPEETLNSTAVSQPAIFTVSLAVVRAIEEAAPSVANDPLGCTRDANGACTAVAACKDKADDDINLVNLFGTFFESLPEFATGCADRARQLRQLAGAEKQQQRREDDDPFPTLEIHRLTSFGAMLTTLNQFR